jgi:hypothetical protein
VTDDNMAPETAPRTAEGITVYRCDADCSCGCHDTFGGPARFERAPLDEIREAFLAGVRRGVSDGMEAYPEVADDYLTAREYD